MRSLRVYVSILYKFMPDLSEVSIKDLNIFCAVFVSFVKIESLKASVSLWA
jgi:hypothetical protein